MTIKIDNLIDKMIEDRTIDEGDRLAAKTVLTWLHKGREEAEKVSSQAVKNLVKCGFVSRDGKSLVGEPETVWYCLAILGAQGLVMQTIEKEGKSD